jgi:hypothetical protein
VKNPDSPAMIRARVHSRGWGNDRPPLPAARARHADGEETPSKCISDKIKLHSSNAAGCKDMPAQQLFIFLSTGCKQLSGDYGRANNCFVRCNTRAVRQCSNAGAIPTGKSH